MAGPLIAIGNNASPLRRTLARTTDEVVTIVRTTQEADVDMPATRCEERLFCSTPTLGNDITDVVIDSIFLQVEELWHTLHTLGLRNGTGHEHDVGARSYGMRPFDIKRGLEGPVNHVWITGVEFNRTQWC